MAKRHRRHPRSPLSRSLIAGLAALALSACQVAAPVSPVPDSAPEDPPERSAESLAFEAYYANVQERLLNDGFLRTDGGGPDTPITARSLAETFERIALYDEYALSGGRFIQRETPAVLRRWTAPVRLQAHFGPSTTEAERAEDRAYLSNYARRLAGLTGHPVSTVQGNGNFHVLYLNRDEQLAAGDLLRLLVPGIGPDIVREITGLPRFAFCSVYAFSSADNPSEYVAAVAIIRTEHPDLLRRSCVHEEIAQGLGLPNDSPSARPSIFNDDEEFALLTRLDELMLRMLYDRRLAPGISAEEARPVVRQIAEELMGGST
ncbi:DUF2927 domain-containing protein [Rhodobacterales bacterium HKCCE3408]|nr:DUF2927 domain-containing protein [Rhodobacterales bacterium HKCCE3408]